MLDQLKNNYFLTGSKSILGRYFGGHDSDWDFVSHISELPEGVYINACQDLRNYIGVMPMGNAYLWKGDHIDILIYENYDDITCIEQTTNYLKDLVKHPIMYNFLSKKENRIYLFEKTLEYYYNLRRILT